jgi:hypothetical protein
LKVNRSLRLPIFAIAAVAAAAVTAGCETEAPYRLPQSLPSQSYPGYGYGSSGAYGYSPSYGYGQRYDYYGNPIYYGQSYPYGYGYGYGYGYPVIVRCPDNNRDGRCDKPHRGDHDGDHDGDHHDHDGDHDGGHDWHDRPHGDHDGDHDGNRDRNGKYRNVPTPGSLQPPRAQGQAPRVQLQSAAPAAVTRPQPAPSRVSGDDRPPPRNAPQRVRDPDAPRTQIQ